MIYTELTKKAMRIAFDAHKEQTDKDGLPYFHHPLHLAELVDTEEEIVTALLHDVVEDTDWTFDALKREGFPHSVISALELLTHDTDIEYADYVREIRNDAIAVKVKLADLLHNSEPSRLASLPPDTAARLEKKYAEAMKILQFAVSMR